MIRCSQAVPGGRLAIVEQRCKKSLCTGVDERSLVAGFPIALGVGLEARCLPLFLTIVGVFVIADLEELGRAYPMGLHAMKWFGEFRFLGIDV